eukprot:15469178-Alexandrium_andersonii.AAC.1
MGLRGGAPPPKTPSRSASGVLASRFRRQVRHLTAQIAPLQSFRGALRGRSWGSAVQAAQLRPHTIQAVLNGVARWALKEPVMAVAEPGRLISALNCGVRYISH